MQLATHNSVRSPHKEHVQTNATCMLRINPLPHQPGNTMRAEVSSQYSQLAHMVVAPAIEVTIAGQSNWMGPATPDVYHHQLHGLQGLDDTWAWKTTRAQYSTMDRRKVIYHDTELIAYMDIKQILIKYLNIYVCMHVCMYVRKCMHCMIMRAKLKLQCD